MPSPDALADHLAERWRALPAHHREAIAAMYGGPRRTDAGTAGGAGAAAAGGAAPSRPPDAAATDGVDVRQIVSYNAYGDEYEDLVAADLRSGSGGGTDGAAASQAPSSSPEAASAAAAAAAGVRSCVGVWPHFSSLNHACAPNCVHYVVGSTMVVRAVQHVPAGAELLVSYLGRDDLAPRQVRQSILRSRYGFTCDCARCRTEASLPDELGELLRQLYDRSRHELAPRFERLASAAADEAAAVAAGRETAAAEDEDDGDYDSEDGDAEDGSAAAGAGATPPSGKTAAEAAKRALRKSGSSPAHWASQLAALEPRLEECAGQLSAALRVFQACKLLEDALRGQHAPQQARRPAKGPAASAGDAEAAARRAAAAAAAPEAVREAAGLLGQSLLARYGRMPGPQLQRLTQAAMRTSRGFF
ncbi:hypothetical protein GPECTOR_9g484 [Gonium pectorale]|uniref:SET domain-containing protein n=1 Tax=Gonium pectorale TaxID=33097 RepID=A0A150GSY4_GONPE|nr:hypothetical protein GPECTOR_9g484 [Gonium pectorale]|eukprot:KXZ52440.1 hypothetical protein GPECTOR_9g484 [Gonium pectorale]